MSRFYCFDENGRFTGSLIAIPDEMAVYRGRITAKVPYAADTTAIETYSAAARASSLHFSTRV